MIDMHEFIQLFKDNSLPAKNMRVENPSMQKYISDLHCKIREENWKEFIKELQKYVSESNFEDNSKRDCIDSIYPICQLRSKK